MSLLSSLKAMFTATPTHAHEGDCCDHASSAGKPEGKVCCQAEGACDANSCEKDCDCQHDKVE